MRAFSVLKSVVLGLSTIATALDADDNIDECRIRAWVRAPDFEPGQVLQGDVKIKLDGACSDVSSYSIGLRFMERSWVKTRREEVVLPDLPTESMPPPEPSFSNGSIFEPLTFKSAVWSDGHWHGEGVQRSAWETYQNTLRDPTLWLSREEERIGFETRYILRQGEKLNHGLVGHFGMLVPFTNYPPAFDVTFFPNVVKTDRGDYEHIYAYFVDVEFANGTQHEVPAGFTSFRATIKPGMSERETVKANATLFCMKGVNCPSEKKDIPQDELAVEVTFPNGRHFAQGSADFLTIVVHQKATRLQRPLRFIALNTKVNQNLNWAASFAADNETAKDILTSGTLFMREWTNGLMQNPVSLRTKVLEDGTGVSTEAITALLKVPQSCYPSFLTYYQTTEVSLEIILEERDDSWTRDTLEEDEFAWTPKEEETERFRATIPIFVHTWPGNEAPFHSPGAREPVPMKHQPRTDGSSEDQEEPIHYLSSDARAPVFVDPSSISELQQRSRDERDRLAPIAQGKILPLVDRDIVKHRYFDVGSPLRGPRIAFPYYVGDTWLRKVLQKLNEGDGWLEGEVPGTACMWCEDTCRPFPQQPPQLVVQT